MEQRFSGSESRGQFSMHIHDESMQDRDSRRESRGDAVVEDPLVDMFDLGGLEREPNLLQFSLALRKQSATRVASIFLQFFDRERGFFRTMNGTSNPDDIERLARIQNELTRYLVHSKSSETETLQKLIIEELDTKLGKRKKIAECVHNFFSGFGETFHDAPLAGAQAEARYIRLRARMLRISSTGPVTNEAPSPKSAKICTSVSADARHAVDVVELVFSNTPEGTPAEIDALHLVQVKNSEILPEKIEKIHQQHKAYAQTLERYPLATFDLAQQRAREDVRWEEAEIAFNADIALFADTASNSQEFGSTVTDEAPAMPQQDCSEDEHLTALSRRLRYFAVLDAFLAGRPEYAEFANSVKDELASLQTIEQALVKEQVVYVPVRKIVSLVVHGDAQPSVRMITVGDDSSGVLPGVSYTA